MRRSSSKSMSAFTLVRLRLRPARRADRAGAAADAHRQPAAARRRRTLVRPALRRLAALVRAGDLLVFNDTRVIKRACSRDKPTGGRVEMLVERIVADDEAWVQMRASHPPRVGSHAASLPGGARATVRRARRPVLSPALRRHRTAGRVARAPRRRAAAAVHRARAPGADDATRYQTVYAREPGAVAAPTAGLHFDEAMLAALAARGVERAFVTLHVGAGTFQPVQAEDLAQHRMHERVVSHSAATRSTPSPRRARAAAACSPSARRRCARSNRRPPTGRRARRARRETDAVHHAGLSLPRRRPAAHQFPPAAVDAADAGVARSPATTRSARPTRMRSPHATASSATATRCCSSGRPSAGRH